MAEIMKEQAQEASVLDALLGATVPNVEKDLPTARYKVDRLSQPGCGIHPPGAALRQGP